MVFMKAVSMIIVAVLVLLAVSSGTAKVLLMQQDVVFFGKYGFTNPVLIAFGSAQILAGLLMIVKRTRFAGAAIVAFTFLVSLALLVMDGNVPVSMITAVATLLLVLVMRQSWQSSA